MSLLTIVALSMVVTALVWPYEADRLLNKDDIVVLQAVVDAREDQALLFSRAISKYSPTGSDYRVTIRDLQHGGSSDTPWQAVSLLNAPGGVIVGEIDGTIRRLLRPWHASQSEILGHQPDGAPIKLSCSADGRRLLSLGIDHLYVWDLQADRLLRKLPRGEIVEAALSADGECFYHSSERQLLERCARSGEVLRVIPIDCEPLELACSPDGQYLAMLGCDGSLNMLQVASGQSIWQKRVGHPTLVAATVTFDPFGRNVVTARHSDDRSDSWMVEVSNVISGQCEICFPASQRVFGAAITADQRVQSWGAGNSFCQWSLFDPPAENRRQLTAQLDPQPGTAME